MFPLAGLFFYLRMNVFFCNLPPLPPPPRERERERERFCWKPHRTEGKSPGCEMYICRIVIQIRSVCRGKFPPVKGTGQQHAESLFIARSCNCLQARFPSARRGSDRCENVRGLKMRVEGIRRSKLHPPVHALPQS